MSRRKGGAGRLILFLSCAFVVVVGGRKHALFTFHWAQEGGIRQ